MTQVAHGHNYHSVIKVKFKERIQLQLNLLLTSITACVSSVPGASGRELFRRFKHARVRTRVDFSISN